MMFSATTVLSSLLLFLPLQSLGFSLRPFGGAGHATAFAKTALRAADVEEQFSAAADRATYLTEPTDEFKESEKQRMEFRKAQLDIKKKFTTVLTRLTTESQTEDELRSDLEELQGLVKSTGGLPLGIKKEEIVKLIRGKKAKGFWPTSVEIAYQNLNTEIRYQQSPNTDKDLENPL